VQSIEAALARLSVRKRRAARWFSLADGLPSLPSADSFLPAFVRAFPRYYAIVRLPKNVHVGRTAHGLRQPARGLSATGVPGVSRFSRLEFPRMPRVYDPAGSGSRLKLSPAPMLPSAPATWASAPRWIKRLRSSIPSLRVPLSTLHPHPYGCWRMTRGQGGSLLLSCAALSSATPSRFIPAHAAAIYSPSSM